MNAPRLLIAGTHSGVGKTTVTAGLLAALRARGRRVQAFKVGPDFIDPTFHEAATGRPSHNLDAWMLSREANRRIFARAMETADVAVIEGMMGLFDGKSAPSLAGSTAEMALWLDAAVVLVVDASAMAGSAAAVVHGFDTLLPELRVAAVICNRAAGDPHYHLLRDAIAARCRPEPAGYLPADAEFAIPERHLGLHLAGEAFPSERMSRLAAAVEAHVNVDRLLALAARPPLPCAAEDPLPRPASARIGIARDAAFCFYYRDNLELLRSLGAELVEFSPLADAALPPGLDGIYLGGGYPELHAQALSANANMRAALASLTSAGAPVYAECGGFMYLTNAIADADGRTWPMAGVFPTTARMHSRLARIGYVEVEARDAAQWLPSGQTARGHEFRYSTIDPMPPAIARVYCDPAEAYRVHSVMGSYVHLHFRSCPAFAENFVRACAMRRGKDSQ